MRKLNQSLENSSVTRLLTPKVSTWVQIPSIHVKSQVLDLERQLSSQHLLFRGSGLAPNLRRGCTALLYSPQALHMVHVWRLRHSHKRFIFLKTCFYFWHGDTNFSTQKAKTRVIPEFKTSLVYIVNPGANRQSLKAVCICELHVSMCTVAIDCRRDC